MVLPIDSTSKVLTGCVLVVVCLMTLGGAGKRCFAEDAGRSDQEFREVFESRYKAWRSWIERHPFAGSHTTCKEFGNLCELGIQAVPLMITKMAEHPEAFSLSSAVATITRRRFGPGEWPPGKRGDAITAARLYEEWWRTGRAETPKRFRELYAEWLEARDADASDEARKTATRITDLGLDVLPLLVEKLCEGDQGVVGLIAFLTRGEVGESDAPDSVLRWWDTHRDEWTLPPSPETPGSAVDSEMVNWPAERNTETPETGPNLEHNTARADDSLNLATGLVNTAPNHGANSSAAAEDLSAVGTDDTPSDTPVSNRRQIIVALFLAVVIALGIAVAWLFKRRQQ